MNTPLKGLIAVMAATLLSGAAYADPSTDLPDENDTAPSSSVPVPTPRPEPSNPYNQGTTADGRTIVAPGTYGPFQGPTCEAGSSGCAPASPAVSGLAATEQALTDIGAQQRNDAVKKMEDDMVKNGTYQSIERDPAGKGAIITLPDGMIAYSDYVRGLDTMPKTPEQWANDPTAPNWLRQKMQAAVDAKAADEANKKMFGAASTDKGDKSGKMSMMSTGENKGAGDGTTEAGATDNQQDSTDPNSMADVGGMGGQIAANYNGSDGGSSGSGLSGPGGPNFGGASSDRARADNQRAMQAATKQALESAGDGDRAAEVYTYDHLRQEARDGAAFKALRNARVHSSNGASEGDNVNDDKATRGTTFFGR